MRRLALVAALCAAGLTSVSLQGLAQNGNLTVVGAGGVLQDAERKAFFEPFGKEAGVAITEDSYSGQIAKLRAMVNSGTVAWDVMQVEQNTMLSGCEEGLFETLDWTRIGNKDDFIPDAHSDCGLGAFVWSMVMTYDNKVIAEGPKTWTEFWDVKRWPGKRGFRQTAKMTLEIALLADGVPPGEIYTVLSTPEGQDRAFAKLDEIKSEILWWTSGAEAIERLAAGDIALSAAFNGRVVAANAGGKDFALNWHGQVYGIDYWGIVKGSANKAIGEDFIRFAGTPKAQANFPKYIAYGVTNREAIASIPPDLAKNLPTSPDNLAVAVGMSTEFWADNGESLEARFSTWRSQ